MTAIVALILAVLMGGHSPTLTPDPAGTLATWPVPCGPDDAPGPCEGWVLVTLDETGLHVEVPE